MEPGSGLETTLEQLWNNAFNLALFVLGVFIAKRLEKRRNEPVALAAVNWLLFIALCSWFLSYLISTRYELEAMALVFNRSDLPGFHLSIVLVAIALTIGFVVLLLFHRAVYVVGPAILLIGVADMRGNASLASGMQLVRERAGASSVELTAAQQIWLDYYLVLPQQERIVLYMALALLGMLISLAALSRFAATSALEAQSQDGVIEDRAGLVDWARRHWVTLEVIGRLLIVAAVLINEALIWGWRIDREIMLSCEGASLYLSWDVQGVAGGCAAPSGG